MPPHDEKRNFCAAASFTLIVQGADSLTLKGNS
jgi:hypothetical protein